MDFKKIISKAVRFIKVELWRIRLRNVSGLKYFFIRQLRIIILAFKGFDEDNCILRASALTLYSLLSIVPVLAMAFGIAKGFGFEKVLKEQLLLKFQGQEKVIMKIIEFAQSMLANTRGGMVAGIGVIFLVWIVIRVLGNVENAFNIIWGIKKPRTMSRKFSDYLVVMIISPVLFIASSSFTMFIASQVEYVANQISLLGAISPALFGLLKLLPYVIICILFAFIYIFMPNTKVEFRSGLLAGLTGGIIYQLIQWGYLNFQIGVSRYNAIYGSFAALPLFIIWLQISWLIVLFGAEISFAHQNVETYEFEPDCLKASYAFKKLLSIRIMNLLVNDFCEGEPKKDASDIVHSIGAPMRLVREVLFTLEESGLVSRVQLEEEGAVAFQPAVDVNKITIKKVIEKMERKGTDNIPLNRSKELDKLSKSLKEFDETLRKSSSNKLLKEI